MLSYLPLFRKILFYGILFAGLLFPAQGHAGNENRILLISSYSPDYKWSNQIIDAIKNGLIEHDAQIDPNIEFLSSEFYTDPESWGQKMSTILENYTEKKPAAIVLISDEAWMGYMAADNRPFSDVPLVLVGVKPHTIGIADYTSKFNSLTLNDFTSTEEVMKTYGATGILRQMNIEKNIWLMKELNPDLTGFIFITDKRFYGVYCDLLCQEVMKRDPSNLPAIFINARNFTTDSMLHLLSTLPQSHVALLTSWLTGEHGFEFSKEYTYQQIYKELGKPLFITNDIGLEKNYFLGGYFMNASFWGNECVKILLQILKGTKPSEIPITTHLEDQCQIDWGSLTESKISESVLPPETIIWYKPESVYTKYKPLLLMALGIFILITASLILTLRAYLKRRMAQAAILELNRKTEIANQELRRSREELEVALEKAEESDRLKSAFIANISHEIRTPLNAIVGFSDLIGSVESDTERKTYIEIIQKNNELLLQLVNDIMELSRIEAGKISLHPANISVPELLNDLRILFAKRTKPKVPLIVDEVPEPYTFLSDRRLVMQILSHFLSNAIKFTDKGAIHMGCSISDGAFSLYVKDTGRGIPPESMEMIFERFTKLDTYAQGIGIGLHLCQIIARQLNVRLHVESTPGKGSEFSIIFPA